jgi:hypothetical protein
MNSCHQSRCVLRIVVGLAAALAIAVPAAQAFASPYGYAPGSFATNPHAEQCTECIKRREEMLKEWAEKAYEVYEKYDSVKDLIETVEYGGNPLGVLKFIMDNPSPVSDGDFPDVWPGGTPPLYYGPVKPPIGPVKPPIGPVRPPQCRNDDGILEDCPTPSAQPQAAPPLVSQLLVSLPAALSTLPIRSSGGPPVSSGPAGPPGPVGACPIGRGGPNNPCGSCPNGNCLSSAAKNNAAKPQVASAPANHPGASNPLKNAAPIGSTTNPNAGVHHPLSPGGTPTKQIGSLGGTGPHPGGLGALHPGGLGGLHPGGLGGLHSGGLGGFGGFRHSDIRLKQDIVPIGRLADGLELYRFRYIGEDQVYVGVMAQHVRAVAPEAVIRGSDGYLRVNYQRLGLKLQTWDEWLATSK